MPTKITRWLILALILLGGVFVARQRRATEPVQSMTRFLMYTYCTIQVPGEPRVREKMARAFDRLAELDQKFNALNTNSPIYRFNHANTPITDPEIISVVRTALEVSAQTDGALDITIFPVVQLWGFFGPAAAVPPAQQLAASLQRVGWKNLAITDGKLVKCRSDVYLDLGAVAKGYGAGAVVQTLQQLGVRSALVDLGGNLYALGTRYGKNWKVGLRQPRGHGVLGTLELTDGAVATSGDYERFFVQDGVRQHHIFDPRTGHPARGLISATAITADPTLADAYSTALFVLGPEKALRLVAVQTNLECVLVTEAGRVLVSPRLRARFALAP